jgi:hypothetical protein
MSTAEVAADKCLGLPPLVRQTVKTLFAVRCKMLDQQDEITSF